MSPFTQGGLPPAFDKQWFCTLIAISDFAFSRFSKLLDRRGGARWIRRFPANVWPREAERECGVGVCVGERQHSKSPRSERDPGEPVHLHTSGTTSPVRHICTRQCSHTTEHIPSASLPRPRRGWSDGK